jgi:DNA segregation ATPase FtsK/SpoIIIE, S-DNA-T family
MYVDRPPRIQQTRPQGEVEIPSPPAIKQNTRQPWWQTGLPLITIVVYLIASSTGSGGRSIALIIPMALTSLISLFMAFYTIRQADAEDARKNAAYRQRLIAMRKEMDEYHERQRVFFEYNTPAVEILLRSDSFVAESRFGPRLWERRTSDDDFGSLRLGIGTLPSDMIYKINEAATQDEHPLMQEAVKLAHDSRFVSNIPIMLPLHLSPSARQKDKDDQEDQKIFIPYSVGISGIPEDVQTFVYGLIVDYATFHSPDDASLYVVGVYHSEQAWSWLNKLPHCRPVKGADPSSFPICFEDSTGRNVEEPEYDKVSIFWKTLRIELDRRERRLREGDGKDDISFPMLLVVVDLLSPSVADGDLPPPKSSLEDIESEAAVSMIMNKGAQLGAAVLFLVSDSANIPSGCKAVIEINSQYQEKPAFHYAEVGVNSRRYLGVTESLVQEGQGDAVNDRLAKFASTLSQWQVRRSYGGNIPDSVSLMELHDVERIDELEIDDRWDNSTNKNDADWLNFAIGKIASGETRRLTVSANKDGVHFMIAGSTGSGKSELLMTLILALAVEYDPTIVNFVLVDFKGGAAFTPFKNLPHRVDTVTDLEGSAVERMFTAITAELKRREHVFNSDETKCKDIVEYRRKGYHLQPGKHMPHLLIIIDEFAEMIAGNPEYRSQLESITRLGRALGVTLVLAAQRPSGITDQMRANIKCRICLRVETREESSEMLRLPDAAFLPSIPGRGYLQIGNESTDQIQVGYSGMEYGEFDISQYANEDIVWIDSLRKTYRQPELFTVLVDTLEKLAKQKQIPKQEKPWPSPLPRFLSLVSSSQTEDINARFEVNYLDNRWIEYLGGDSKTETADQIKLNPHVWNWFRRKNPSWQKNHDGDWWNRRAMKAVVGLLDDPSKAHLHPLMLDLARDHVVVYGASASGKSTFLRTLILSLTATHSPKEMHLYILDFGNRTLNIFARAQADAEDFLLPHLADYLLPYEKERVERLLRALQILIEKRKDLLAQSGKNSIYSYNSAFPDKAEPAIVIVVDNFASYRENYWEERERLQSLLINLLLEGTSKGIHFVFTADRVGIMPGKLSAQITRHIALRLANADEYAQIAGRAVRGIEESPGHGITNVGRGLDLPGTNKRIEVGNTMLHLQVALPLALNLREQLRGEDGVERLIRVVQKMRNAFDGFGTASKPLKIIELDTHVNLQALLSIPLEQSVGLGRIAFAKNYDDLQVRALEFKTDPNFVIVGPLQSGKTTALRTMILSMAQYSPQQVAIVMIDARRRLWDFGEDKKFSHLPHVLETIVDRSEVQKLIKKLHTEYSSNKKRHIFVVIDNYDDSDDILSSEIKKELAPLANYSANGLHFVLAVSNIRGSDELIKKITVTFGVSLDVDSAKGVFNAKGEILKQMEQIDLPKGRGFLIKGRTPYMIQIGAPFDAATEDPALAFLQWIDRTISQHEHISPAQWSMPAPESAAVTPLAVSAPSSVNSTALQTEQAQKVREIMNEWTENELKKFKPLLRGQVSMLKSILSSDITDTLGEECEVKNLNPDQAAQLAKILKEKLGLQIAKRCLGDKLISALGLDREENSNDS